MQEQERRWEEGRDKMREGEMREGKRTGQEK